MKYKKIFPLLASVALLSMTMVSCDALKRFFNTSGIQYREMELSKKLPDMSEDEQFRLLASDGMLVKRPLLVGKDFVLTGFKEDEWKKILL